MVNVQFVFTFYHFSGENKKCLGGDAPQLTYGTSSSAVCKISPSEDCISSETHYKLLCCHSDVQFD